LDGLISGIQQQTLLDVYVIERLHDIYGNDDENQNELLTLNACLKLSPYISIDIIHEVVNADLGS
jgi:hypothetical protein